MSMFAEKRAKEKWSNDPQNTRWSSDRSKFGYRMLEAMGWKEGQGLGLKEDGSTEHVRVSRKVDNSGVGFTKGRDEGWLQQQDDFEQILASLNESQQTTHNASTPEKSHNLLSTAESVRAGKLVYKKFLQGKDMSQVSTEDLDCVLGRRGKKRRRREEEEGVRERGNEQVETTMSAVKDTEVVSHGVATITRGLSVHDYFAQKLSTNRTTSNRTEDKMSNANPQSCDSAYRSCDFLTRSCDSTSSPCDSSLRSCDTELLYSSPNNQLPMDKSARLIDDAVTMDTKLVARRKGRKKRKKMTGHEGHSLASSYCYV